MTKAVPIDPLKLIEAARDLADHQSGQGRPRPVHLRRAVSTAYYALFHRISRDAAEQLLPGGSKLDQLKLARTFGHKALKDNCAQIAGRQGKTHKHVKTLIEGLRSTPIEGVAASFCDLQEARHRADYDHLAPISKPMAIGHIEDARKAIQTLEETPVADRRALFAVLAIGTRLT